MNATWRGGLVAGVALALLAGVVIGMNLSQPAAAQGEGGKGGGGPRYTVIDTEGHNLLVTDNGTNTLYFYTTDKDAPIGSELKLRGSLDLTHVGKDTLVPKIVKREEKTP